jgi:hypothetical protein
MAMKKRPQKSARFVAEFEGFRIERIGRTWQFTHAWLRREKGRKWELGGFSISEEHAKRAIDSFCRGEQTRIVRVTRMDSDREHGHT